MSEDVSLKTALSKPGPKYLKGSKHSPISKAIIPKELSQEEWDIIHGPDPMSIFEHRRIRRRHPDPERQETVFSGKYVGKAWDPIDLFEECKQCGSMRGYHTGWSVGCLGCRTVIEKVQVYEKLATEFFAKKAKEEAEKKAAKQAPSTTADKTEKK